MRSTPSIADCLSVTALSVALMAFTSMLASASAFKKQEECVVGARVVDRAGKTGIISEVNGTTCKVKLDATGKLDYYIFWMLSAADGSGAVSKSTNTPGKPSADKAAAKPNTNAGDKLTQGLYPCYSLAGTTLNYAFIDVRIEGPDKYSDNKGKSGKYRIDPSGKIAFESGPLKTANAKLLSGPRIGLNMDGGNFFNTSCSLKK